MYTIGAAVVPDRDDVVSLVFCGQIMTARFASALLGKDMRLGVVPGVSLQIGNCFVTSFNLFNFCTKYIVSQLI